MARHNRCTAIVTKSRQDQWVMPRRNFRPTQTDLIARKLGEETIWLYGTPDYLAGLNSAEVSELTDVQIIGSNRSSQVSDLLSQKGWQLSNQNFQLITSFQL
jgi:hypothetical protein